MLFAVEDFPADPVEVVGQDAAAHVAQVALQADVQAAVQAVMFEGVDLALDGAVLLAQGDKLFALLPFGFRGVLFAALGHDDFGNVEAEECAVFGAGEAFVEGEAGDGVVAVAGQEPAGHGDALVDIDAADRHVVILHKLIFVGRDEQTVAELREGGACLW